MRTGVLLAFLGVVAATAVISGSNAFPRTADDADEFVAARAALEASLDRASVRLSALSSAPHASLAEGAGLRAEVDEMAERGLAIQQALDSLSIGSDDQWRGAMPGLRASVTNLEARIDRAELASFDSVATVDSLLAAWLEDTRLTLTALDAHADPATPFGAHADEIERLRQSRRTLADRLAVLAGIDDDRGLRVRLGEELIAIRRRVRGLERAAGSDLHPRFP
jgi:hypothetical protein